MKCEWKEYVLANVLADKGYIRGPFGSALKRNEMLDKGIPVYEQQNAIYDNRKFRYFIDGEKFKSMKRFKVETDDLIISCSGTVGKVSIIKQEDIKGIISQALLLLRVNTNIILPLYLKYFFASSKGYNAIVERSSGSVQVNISKRNVIEQIPLNLPSIKDQERIVALLKSIDDKIELNNKINDNLEQQAQAIFKSWFVDFEPFGGVMPSDWEVGTFSKITDKTLGGDWGKDSPIANYTKHTFCIRGADIPDIKTGKKGKMPTRYILEKNFDNKRLAKGDIVVEISGGSPTQSTGRVAVVSKGLLAYFNEEIICTNFCRALTPKLEYSMFMYHYWQYLYDLKVFFSYENGTTGIKNLDINGFLESEIINIPSLPKVNEFDDICQTIYHKIYSNGNETEKLAQLRDTLLPKLMSGEIDVSKVEI